MMQSAASRRVATSPFWRSRLQATFHSLGADTGVWTRRDAKYFCVLALTQGDATQSLHHNYYEPGACNHNLVVYIALFTQDAGAQSSRTGTMYSHNIMQ